MDSKATNVIWHPTLINKMDRQRLNQHKSCVLWFTGLSASGKSTIANEVEKRLHDMQVRSYLLDGDNIRKGLNKNLGFSPEDRKENIRRIGEVAALFVDAGLFVLTAFISPYREDRAMVRSLFPEGEFIEIHVHCPLEVCEQRDPKGLYQRARQQQIPEFTGITAPYEEPDQPELVLETDKQSVEDAAEQVIRYLTTHHLL